MLFLALSCRVTISCMRPRYCISVHSLVDNAQVAIDDRTALPGTVALIGAASPFSY